MKKYKNGKMIDVTAEEAEEIKKCFDHHMSKIRNKRVSGAEYESKIQELEKTVENLKKSLDDLTDRLSKIEQ